MSDSAPDSSVAKTEPTAKVAPTLQLSRTGLMMSLLAMVTAGLAVYTMFPESVGGPPLPVEVAIDSQPVETTSGRGAVVTEVVVVKNSSENEIPKLTIEINGQYLIIQEKPLSIGESLVLPQSIFTDKRSSQRFNPGKYDVADVTVTGQLPNGARGVSKFEYEHSNP